MTPLFLDPLRVEQVGWHNGRPEWRTLAPLRYRSAILGGIVTIPKDFDTDLASVPRLILTWFVAGGRAPRAAVIHDYGYQTGGLILDGAFTVVSRIVLDEVLSEASAADPMSGTNAVTRGLMWAGVRAGGWLAWRRHEQRGDALNPEWSSTAWPQSTEAS